jgi:preprotein translocase subunit SecA
MAGMKQGEVIESGMLTRQIEKAQRKVESHNFDIRKQLLLFDDVANDQRKVVYQQRTEIMATEDLSAAIIGIMEESVGTVIDQYIPKTGGSGDWALESLAETLQKDFNVSVDPKSWLAQEPDLEEPALRARIVKAVADGYQARIARSGPEIMRHIEKEVMLKMLDQHWREHLAAMDYLRQGIHLRGYAQKDYRFEYKREAFELFAAMLDRVKFEVVSFLSKIEIRTAEEVEREEEERRQRLMRALQAQHAEAQSVLSADNPGPPEPAPGSDNPFGQVFGGLPGAIPQAAGQPPVPQMGGDVDGTFVRGDRKVGRNELCPCGSGKKFKHCHGTL